MSDVADYSQFDASGVDPRGLHRLPPRQVAHPANNNEENHLPRQRQGPNPYAFAFSEEELRREPEDEEFLYKFPETYTGLVILIINSQFDHEKRRDYAEQDLDKMQNVFGCLGFQMRLMRNFTTQQLHNNLKEVSKENIIQHIGCLACVISSHGSEEAIGKGEKDEYLPDHVTVYEHFISTKDGQMRTRRILEMFDDDNCRSLRGKPRLFFIQACRSRVDVMDPMSKNKAFDEGVTLDITEEIVPGQQPWQHNKHLLRNQPIVRQHSQVDAAHTMPKKIANGNGIEFYEHTTPDLPRTVLAPPVCLNHFLVMFASMPEKVAWSDGRGGWLLDSLHDIFKDKIIKKQPFSLMTALLEVNRMVTLRQSYTADGRFDYMKSMPCMEHKLTKEIILEPKPTKANMY